MGPDLTTTAAFSGHRTYGGEADLLLRRTVEELYARGMRTFLCGMAMGFDLAAARVVLDMRSDMPGMQLVAVVPFRGQEERFPAADRACFDQVLAAADRVVVLAPAYRPGCYAVRNNYLVDHASLLVAWYDGSPGGTHYTVRRALARGRELVNLCLFRPQVPASDPTLF